MMSAATFFRSHISQITGTSLVVSYALIRRKFTLGGVVAGVLVSLIHMLHPWPAFYWLLNIFVLFGILVTRIGHAAKSHITQSSIGGSGGEGARTSAQVFANSGTACILVLMHTWLLNSSPFISSNLPITAGPYSPLWEKLLPIGIIGQYAAVAADTFSSELGILAKSQPILITAPWKRVPRGTNGGVTVEGLLYGTLGSLLLTLVAGGALRGLYPNITISMRAVGLLTLMGVMGSIIDSVLGALVQVTVTDKATGKVVEGPGGQRVQVVPGGSRTKTGLDLLTNNGVNFTMATATSLLTMGVFWAIGIDLQ
ncbi:hypothetical protein M433DRAFT_155620 [Acidomyces richmondensis BFW]|nr:MAG: hypothetical protein FE78DRAFT_92453 [Acidomyces sp. 'richmondensis']KYG44435.1 hypothetical protein M433DRAFT_155620 [Acidomyces richmondensis BFW]